MSQSVSLTNAELALLRQELGNACMRADDRVEDARDHLGLSGVNEALRERETVERLAAKIDRACDRARV